MTSEPARESEQERARESKSESANKSIMLTVCDQQAGQMHSDADLTARERQPKRGGERQRVWREKDNQRGWATERQPKERGGERARAREGIRERGYEREREREL